MYETLGSTLCTDVKTATVLDESILLQLSCKTARHRVVTVSFFCDSALSVGGL